MPRMRPATNALGLSDSSSSAEAPPWRFTMSVTLEVRANAVGNTDTPSCLSSSSFAWRCAYCSCSLDIGLLVVRGGRLPIRLERLADAVKDAVHKSDRVGRTEATSQFESLIQYHRRRRLAPMGQFPGCHAKDQPVDD